MNFQSRELRFGLAERDRFDAEAVKKALQAQRFANVELLSAPAGPSEEKSP